jgi:hypothetical protein
MCSKLADQNRSGLEGKQLGDGISHKFKMNLVFNQKLFPKLTPAQYVLKDQLFPSITRTSNNNQLYKRIHLSGFYYRYPALRGAK